ncbi:MAG TPA: DnaJ domain-containing protein [Verrucomicrobiae bacterium]|nr:DnaJ domain-containing protein [Verrucomicrobiae bacterium]
MKSSTSDYFALLGEPHRPWLDPEGLKAKFLSLSSEFHPDHVGGTDPAEKSAAERRYAELNEAYQHLKKPKERLQHLLETETGAKPAQVQQIPEDLMDLFMQVGNLLKQADALLKEKEQTTSPLLQVRCFEAGQVLTEQLVELQKKLTERRQELLTELQAIDARWMDQARTDAVARATMLRRLEQLYRLFSYYSRWEEQAQERIVQLAL